MSMRKNIYLLIIILGSMICSTSESFGENQKKTQLEVLTFQTDSNESLSVKVYLPEGYHTSKKDYLALYTTAGSRRFELMTSMLDWLSHVDWSPVPQMVLVSVPSVTNGKFKNKDDGASGKFDPSTTLWIKNKLIPYIDGHYRMQSFRVIEGFSSYGNYPLYVFQNHPELFQAFISLSPALPLDKSGLVESFDAHWGKQTKTEKYDYKSLYLSLGSMSESLASFNMLKGKLTPFSDRVSMRIADNSKEFYLQPPVTSLTEALVWIFSDRNPSTQKLLELYQKDGIESVNQYFIRLKPKYGEVFSSDSAIQSLADHYIDNQDEEGIKLLTLLTKNEPDNAYYLSLLAQGYEKLGDKTSQENTIIKALNLSKKQKNQEAIEYFTHVLDNITQ